MYSKNIFTKSASVIICLALILSMALLSAGCQSKANDNTPSSTASVASNEEKEVYFSLTVVDIDGNETKLDITTTEKTVGAALLKEGIIEGEEGQYGLYVKKVNGITADYDVDGTYWAFYIGDEYANTGVDQTEIVNGRAYYFKVQK